MRRYFHSIILVVAAISLWRGAEADTIFSDVDTMRIEDAYGLPGDTVNVSVIMSNRVSIEGIQHRIVYDETRLLVDTVYCVERGCNLENFLAIDSIPGVIKILAVTWFENRVLPGSGPAINISFIVRPSAIPGTVLTIEFENQVLVDNSWSDSLGANLIIPQLIPGTFSILGGGINMPPVLGYIGPQSVAEGQVLQFNVFAHDPTPSLNSAWNLPPTLLSLLRAIRWSARFSCVLPISLRARTLF
jgi:hypothetical protein